MKHKRQRINMDKYRVIRKKKKEIYRRNSQKSEERGKRNEKIRIQREDTDRKREKTHTHTHTVKRGEIHREKRKRRQREQNG